MPGGRARARRAVLTGAVLAAGLTLVPTPARATPVSCADGGECALGDTGPGGGTVFFVRGEGAFAAQHVFPDADPDCASEGSCEDVQVSVAMTAEEQAALAFDYLELAPPSSEVDRVWSPSGHLVPGAASGAFGAGAANTAAIVAAFPLGSAADAAAHHAADFVHGSLSDWFLPSEAELSLLLIRKQTLGAELAIGPGYLWSSTQAFAGIARARNMTTAHHAFATQHGASVGVRPIRAFSATATTTTTSTTTTSTTTTTVVPVPVEVVLPRPTPPAPRPWASVPPTTVQGGIAGPAVIVDGAPVDVPLPLAAPAAAVSAAAAVDATRSVAVTRDGQVFTTAPADDHGGVVGRLNEPIVGIQLQLAPPTGAATTPVVSGYWLVAADGGVFTFGSARFHGSTADLPLNAPVVGLTPTGDGGYWLLAADGGVFSFGDARFHGSLGSVRTAGRPTVALVPAAAGAGYWIVGAGGQVSAFGEAPSLGSAAPSSGIVGAAPTPGGRGYWLVTGDGEVLPFGDAST